MDEETMNCKVNITDILLGMVMIFFLLFCKHYYMVHVINYRQKT